MNATIRDSTRYGVLVALSALMAAYACPAKAQKHGAGPVGGLVCAGGHYYGTTYQAGKYGAGTIFEYIPEPIAQTSVDISSSNIDPLLEPDQNSPRCKSPVKTLHNFTGGFDGGEPTSGLICGGDHCLYGTTSAGGDFNSGTVFKINFTTGKFTTLHSFTGGGDGSQPLSGVTYCKGNDPSLLFGTTYSGGANGAGTVYKIDLLSGQLTCIYSFCPKDSIGTNPVGGLAFDSAGTFLYGTTTAGGANGAGTIFKIEPPGALDSRPSIVHDFDPQVGGAYTLIAVPNNCPAAKSYSFLGTTPAGGDNLAGNVFGLDATDCAKPVCPQHSFVGVAASDGANPNTTLLLYPGGCYYGTTLRGGKYDAGTVYKFTPGVRGSFATIYSFTGGVDGARPVSLLKVSNTGDLIGVTAGGGAHGNGTMFMCAKADIANANIDAGTWRPKTLFSF